MKFSSAAIWTLLALTLISGSACRGQAGGESSDIIIHKSMSGHKIKIPSHLILATMQYADGTGEQDVTDFDFVLELPNLDEILSPDQKFRYSNPPPPTEGHGFFEEWLIGTISTSQPAKYGGNYPLDRFHFWNNDVLKDGPYNQMPDEFEMKHWVIDAKKYKNPKVLPSSIHEYYYSYDQNTIITCINSKTVIPPFYSFSDCEQSFNVEKYKAAVTVHYSRIYLKNWLSMQKKIVAKFEELNL